MYELLFQREFVRYYIPVLICIGLSLYNTIILKVFIYFKGIIYRSEMVQYQYFVSLYNWSYYWFIIVYTGYVYFDFAQLYSMEYRKFLEI